MPSVTIIIGGPGSGKSEENLGGFPAPGLADGPRFF